MCSLLTGALHISIGFKCDKENIVIAHAVIQYSNVEVVHLLTVTDNVYSYEAIKLNMYVPVILAMMCQQCKQLWLNKTNSSDAVRYTVMWQ